MKWCELTILAGASSLLDVSNVIYSSDYHCTFTPQEALVRANFLYVSNQDHYHYLHVIALNSIDT